MSLFVGDVRNGLRTFAPGSVQTCVTSPPYWGLRDYGHADQLGLEPTIAEYVANMVDVFRLVREVLADDGTLWLNIGDSYAGSGRGGNPTHATSTLQGSLDTQDQSMVKRQTHCLTVRGSRLPAGLHESARQGGAIGRAWVPPPLGLKQKDLCGMPWRVAFALQADGWWLRSDIIWSKPNPMPESVTDRPTKAHEYLFLLAKSERYYYDAAAIAEPIADSSVARLAQDVANQAGSARANGGAKDNGPMRAVSAKAGIGEPREVAGAAIGIDDRKHAGRYTMRNKRTVWTIPTESFSDAHFATFPTALVEPCILAGSRVGDIVLDPFMGSGTVAQVAQALGRRWLGCELNPDYAKMIERRTAQAGMAFA